MEAFDKAIIANPNSDKLYFYKAKFLEKLGRNDEAIEEYKKGK